MLMSLAFATLIHVRDGDPPYTHDPLLGLLFLRHWRDVSASASPYTREEQGREA